LPCARDRLGDLPPALANLGRGFGNWLVASLEAWDRHGTPASTEHERRPSTDD
jgi:hypothetical protein